MGHLRGADGAHESPRWLTGARVRRSFLFAPASLSKLLREVDRPLAVRASNFRSVRFRAPPRGRAELVGVHARVDIGGSHTASR